MDFDIRKLLHESARASRSRLDFEALVRRGRKALWVKRLRFGTVALVVMIGSIGVSSWLSRTNFESSSIAPSGPGRSGRLGQESDTNNGIERFDIESTPLTSEVVVASGSEAGVPWTLTGRLTEVTDPSGTTRVAPCLGFHYPSDATSGPGTGMLCMGDPGHSIRAGRDDFFVAIEHAGTEGADSGNAAYFGATPRATETVELRHENGILKIAQVFDERAELGNHFKFFLGFLPENGAVEVIAKDSEGNVLGRQNHPDSM